MAFFTFVVVTAIALTMTLTSIEAQECGTRLISYKYIPVDNGSPRDILPWQFDFNNRDFTNDEEAIRKIYCGSTIISENYVVTAAHCHKFGEEEFSKLQILVGTTSVEANPGMIVAHADRVYVHEQFTSTGNERNSDIALIRLREPVYFSDAVRPICLPDKNQDLSRFESCVNTGFGTTLRDRLSGDRLQARMNILPDAECSRINPRYKSDTQMCIGTAATAGDNNICNGGSGGLFSCQDRNGLWTLVGVNSYSIEEDESQSPKKRCPVYFVTRVSAFIDWINKIMSENSN